MNVRHVILNFAFLNEYRLCVVAVLVLLLEVRF